MATLQKFENIEDFISHNQKYFKPNYFVFNHLIEILARILSGEISAIKSFNIKDNEGNEIICLLTNHGFTIIPADTKIDSSAIDLLITEIDIKSFNNVGFLGEKKLILKIFEENNVKYRVFKDRIIYECVKLNRIRPSLGNLQLSKREDIKELAEMNLAFHKEEYGNNSSRDLKHMTEFVIGAIQAETILVWKHENKIVSMLHGYIEGDLFYIAHLYTKPSERKKGFGTNLLHYVTSAMFNKGIIKAGLVSDSSNQNSNKVFREIGFISVFEMIQVIKQ